MMMVENSSFSYTGVSMLGYGCGVFQYPHFYYQELDRYKVLPRPYRGSSEGFPGEKL